MYIFFHSSSLSLPPPKFFPGDCCDDKDTECQKTDEDGSCEGNCGTCAELCCCDGKNENGLRIKGSREHELTRFDTRLMNPGVCETFGDCCDDKADQCNNAPPSIYSPPPVGFPKKGDSPTDPIKIESLPYTHHGNTGEGSDALTRFFGLYAYLHFDKR